MLEYRAAGGKQIELGEEVRKWPGCSALTSNKVTGN